MIKYKLLNLWNNSYPNTGGYTKDCGNSKLYAINTIKQNQRDSSLHVSNCPFENNVNSSVKILVIIAKKLIILVLIGLVGHLLVPIN